jgi:hypothetical protein
MKTSCILTLGVVLAAAGSLATTASAAVVSTFAPGNLEGWSSVTLPGGTIGGGYGFFATSATFGNRLLWQDPTGNVGGVTVTTAANADGRGVQHDTGLLRSPTFTLNGDNGSAAYPTVTAISFNLLGGTGTSTGPSSVTVLPGVAVNQPTGQYTAYLGVALHRVGDDAYLLWGDRTANAQSTNWQTIFLESGHAGGSDRRRSCRNSLHARPGRCRVWRLGLGGDGQRELHDRAGGILLRVAGPGGHSGPGETPPLSIRGSARGGKAKELPSSGTEALAL